MCAFDAFPSVCNGFRLVFRLSGTGLPAERRAELRSLVLRRKAERRALEVLRSLDSVKELGGQITSLLGATTMLSAGAEAGMCERFWLKRVVQDHCPTRNCTSLVSLLRLIRTLPEAWRVLNLRSNLSSV